MQVNLNATQFMQLKMQTHEKLAKLVLLLAITSVGTTVSELIT